MSKSTFAKGGTMLVSAITFAFAGFAGQALAATGTIGDTGPDSRNNVSITSSNRCEVTNNNNVSSNNSTTQNAKSGDVDVSGNTTAGGWNSGWGTMSPESWQASGHTYDQWHEAFMSYMASNEGNMRSNWGHMTGGGATSGNATNNNSTSTVISISNGSPAGSAGGACAPGSEQGTGTIDQTGPGSHNGVVLSATNTSKTANNNKVNGANRTGQNATSGSVAGNGNTSVGGQGSGGAGNDNGTGTQVQVGNGSTTPSTPVTGGNGGGNDGSISNTGPDSVNNVIFKSTNSTTVTNNNNVNTSNWTNQTAQTGDANASHNTTVGGGGSGAANNGNGTNQGVALQN